MPVLKKNTFRYFLAKEVHRDTTICLELSSRDLPRIGLVTAFIVDSVLGILEQQMASINDMLLGLRRSLLYIVDSSECDWLFYGM